MNPKLHYATYSPDSCECIAAHLSEAWARFAAAALARHGVTHLDAATIADAMLAEWKIRFVEELQ